MSFTVHMHAQEHTQSKCQQAVVVNSNVLVFNFLVFW